MTKTIQNGRYKIRRSPDRDDVIIADGANAPANILQEQYPDHGIWILTINPSNPPSASVALEGAVSATLQHERTQAYLAISDSNYLGQNSSIHVSPNDKQVWTINPAGTTSSGGENEYYIAYPDLVDGEVLVEGDEKMDVHMHEDY
ncbi:hypothetical protein EC957_002022 [Mortierella hygrophila]|uniref:Uncharacterized protein n=1 Tax=Mortierella hygrophila TaxID=979708 RepID=A0A9P6K7T2_9FUNG|nr:hypothetical protein EC957_002022 [Mortierella hygrophila]